MIKPAEANHPNINLHCILGLSLALLSLFPLTGHALRGDYTIGVEADYSDNIGLVENNEQDDVGLSAFVGAMLDHQATNLDADIRAMFERVTYLDDTFSDENLRFLRGNVLWRPLPNQFHWQIEDYFTQVRRDVTDPTTPNNRVDTNAFSTGPDFFVRMGQASELQLQGRYSDYYFQDADTDSERLSGRIAWVRSIRPNFDLSANLAYEEADFSEASNLDFERTDLFARSETQHGRSELTIDVGATKIDRDAFEDIDGFLGRVTYLRQIGVNTRLELEASTQYTDSGTDLLTAGESTFDLDRESEQISGDLFYDRNLEAVYTRGPPENNWAIRGWLRDEDYEILPQDRESQGLRGDIHRNVSGPWFMNAHASYRREKYTQLSETNKDSEFGIGVERQLARRFVGRLDYIFATRDSNLVGGDYDENRIVFLLYYGADPQAFR